MENQRYWNAEVETMPLEKLLELQRTRLQEIVHHAYERTRLYRKKFDQAGVKPGDIKTLDDLKKLPLTEYLTDFCQVTVEEKLAVPWEEVKQVCSTSGTVSGFSQPLAFTKEDFETACINNVARGKWSMGIRPDDVVQNLSGFVCQSMSVRALGATTITEHAGRGKLDFQIKLGNVMGVTVLEHLPSLVLRYFERAQELGIDIRKSKLRLISALGEGWAESYKKRVEKEYGVIFRTFYGLTEAGELAAECEAGGGMHIFGDGCILEIIDPETGEVLGENQEGEIVVTNLFRRAMPVIRYRTGDIARILPYESCPCGRTHPRLSFVKGRVYQIIRVAGKKVMPIDVEEVVARVPGLGDEYQIIIDSPGELSKLKLKVEYRPEVKDLKSLEGKVRDGLEEQLRVKGEVELVPPGSLTRALFKAQRVITTYK